MNSARVSWSRALGCRPASAHDRGYLVNQVRRKDQPAQPEPGRQALARGAGVDDVLGSERLHRADRLPVVTELPVVVVLDDQPAGPAGPLHHHGAPPGGQRHPERELVRRGQQHGVGAAKLADRRALGIDGQRRQAQPAVGGHVAVRLQAVGLGGQDGGAARPQRLAQQPEAMGEARADDDPVRVGAHAPGPGEVASQDAAQFRAAARVAVAQRLGRRGGQAPAGRGEPFLARERGQVWRAGPQVIAQPVRLRRRPRCRRAGLGGPIGDLCSGAAPRGQPAFRDELPVRLGHGVPGDAQVAGQRARGRQLGRRAQPPGPHGVPQGRLQAGAHPAASQLQVQVNSRSCPSIRHESGPYPWAGGSPRVEV